jgi:hypothetical protein
VEMFHELAKELKARETHGKTGVKV